VSCVGSAVEPGVTYASVLVRPCRKPSVGVEFLWWFEVCHCFTPDQEGCFQLAIVFTRRVLESRKFRTEYREQFVSVQMMCIKRKFLRKRPPRVVDGGEQSHARHDG
jgi:hypothetical protein